MGSGSYEKMLKKLEELERASHSESIELYINLTRIQLKARPGIKIRETHPSQTEINERVGFGFPVLKFDELQLSWDRVDDLFKEALAIIGEYVPSTDAQASVPLKAAVRSWYNQQPLPHDGSDEEILAVAIHSAVKPFLAKWAEELMPKIKQEKWRRGYCPICGGTPNFAYIEAESGARWLCCPRCDAEWLFQRLECPFCGNLNQKELSYFKDEAGLYRVYTCEACKGYLKAVDLRKSGKDIAVPLEWIKTLDLDRQACERGYKAGIAKMPI
jgi:FdhE protein